MTSTRPASSASCSVIGVADARARTRLAMPETASASVEIATERMSSLPVTLNSDDSSLHGASTSLPLALLGSAPSRTNGVTASWMEESSISPMCLMSQKLYVLMFWPSCGSSGGHAPRTGVELPI